MGFYSRFGGLWYDDTDAGKVLDRLARITDQQLRRQAVAFVRDGVAILPQAVSHAAIDAYLAAYAEAAARPGFMQVEVPMEGGRQAFSHDQALKPGSKVLDTGVLLPETGALSFAPAVSAFLHEMFETPALAFQTLHFEVGSTQAIHQDTAYVVVDAQPMHLIASWIAMEDIRAGSGELVYYLGGHRIPEYAYADGTSKHWNPERDGNPPHDAHLRHLREQAAKLGYREERFLARKGDVLFWHADLPHGGGPITMPGTRRSLVTHYCPVGLQPYYSRFIPESWRIPRPAPRDNAFLSLYFAPDHAPAG